MIAKEEIKEILIDKLCQLFHETKYNGKLFKHIDLVEDLGMDSIIFISFVVEIENIFKITIPDELLIMNCFRNVDEIVDIIKQQLNEVASDNTGVE